MRFGVVVFPGTWSDVDCYHVLDEVLGQEVNYVWHKDTELSSYDCVVLPGGFFVWRLFEMRGYRAVFSCDGGCG